MKLLEIYTNTVKLSLCWVWYKITENILGKYGKSFDTVPIICTLLPV
jgi:hypothetical protein